MAHRSFCANCRVILSDYIQLQTEVPQRSCEQNVVQLDCSAKMACKFCTILRNLLTDEEFQMLDPAKSITFGYKSLVWACRKDFQLTVGFDWRERPGKLIKRLRMISEDSEFIHSLTLRDS